MLLRASSCRTFESFPVNDFVDNLFRGAHARKKTEPVSAERIVRVISWNLLHRSGAVVDDIAQLIEEEQPDLFLMQEATGAIDALPGLAEGHYARQPWPGRRHGLAAWCHSQLQDFGPLQLPASRMPGRFPPRFAQLIQFNDIIFANVHLSHGQVLNRLQLRQISRSTEGPTAIIGDFNTLGPIRLRQFSDVGPRASTHRAQDIVPFRLDRCLIRDLARVSARALRRGRSDHRPILIELGHN